MSFVPVILFVLSFLSLFLSMVFVNNAIVLALKSSRTEEETKKAAKSGMWATFCFFMALIFFILYILSEIAVAAA